MKAEMDNSQFKIALFATSTQHGSRRAPSQSPRKPQTGDADTRATPRPLMSLVSMVTLLCSVPLVQVVNKTPKVRLDGLVVR